MNDQEIEDAIKSELAEHFQNSHGVFEGCLGEEYTYLFIGKVTGEVEITEENGESQIMPMKEALEKLFDLNETMWKKIHGAYVFDKEEHGASAWGLREHINNDLGIPITSSGMYGMGTFTEAGG